MDSESTAFIEGDSPLHSAVRLNQLENVEKILYQGNVDVNSLNSRHETAVYLACSLHYSNSVEVLIAFGADPFMKNSKGEIACQRSSYKIFHLLNRLLYQSIPWTNSVILTDGETPLHEAVRLGKIEDVQEVIIHQDIDINSTNSDYETPLHLACVLGHKYIARVIISNGGNMYKRDMYNNAPIHRALSQGHVDIVDSLISEFECDPHITGYQGRSLLHFACGNGNVEFVTKLIQHHNISPLVTDAIQQTPLHIAASHGKNQIATLLISRYNCPVDSKGSGGNTPLHLASYCGHITLVKHLVLDHKADLKICNEFHETPLHMAAIGGHGDIVNMLITEFNCCPHVVGFCDRSLLHYSCLNGSIDQSTMLITKFGQDPNVIDKNGNTPLHLACLTGHEELVTLLVVKYNCPIDVINRRAESPLHLACAAGHKYLIIKLVSEYKASLTVRDFENDTPLNKAALCGKNDVVHLLIVDFNCSPEVRGFQGRSLLHQACAKGHIELAEMLITEFDLNVSLINDCSNTPLHLACKNGYTELARLLISKYKCNVDATNNRNETPLHFACAAGCFTTVRMLIDECMADINAIDCENNTPANKVVLHGHTDLALKLITEFKFNPVDKHNSLLHYTCLKGHTKLVKELMSDFCPDPNFTNHNGYTPLHMACLGGYDELARLLIAKYNCSVNCITPRNETLLHLACAYGHLSVIRMLVTEFKLDLTACTLNKNTPLHMASLSGHVDTVQMLINELKCNPHSKGYKGQNVLHSACNSGNVKLVEILINDYNIDPMSVDDHGNTALHIAAIYSREEVLRLLVTKHKCPVDCININRQTSLHLAAGHGHTDLCITLLSEFNADCNVYDENNDTPLNIAIKNSKTKTVHTLVCVYPDKFHILGNGSIPLLDQICVAGSTSMFKEMISDFNYDPAAVDEDGNTLLHTAALHGKHEMVEFLITNYSRYCPVDCRNSRGETPFHLACIGGHAKIAKLLVLNYATINLRDEDKVVLLKKADTLKNSNALTANLHSLGNKSTKIDSSLSILYHVCQYGSVQLLDILLFDFHMDPASIVDDHGNTALHVATSCAQKDVVMYLVSSGCPVDCRNIRGQTPLHLLCSQRFNDTVQFLLRWFVTELKADINSRDDRGNQPIHLSALFGCTDVITTLILDFGCDPETRGSKHRTLLHQAFSSGHTSTAKVLIEMFHLSIHSTDSDGNTSLYLSSLYEQRESVKMLLYDYHAPIFVRNKSGKTAFDLAVDNSIKKIFDEYINSEHKSIQQDYEDLKTISQRKYSGEHKITRIFVLGHPESGKSTLVESLKRKGFSSFLQVPESVVIPHTAGIIPTVHQTNENGRLLYFDFAGDREYYSSHSAILEMVSQSTVGTSVYIIVANLTKENITLCCELGYWLAFISHHAKVLDSQCKLKIIVVLSHSDLLTSSDSASRLENVKQYLHDNSNQHERWNLEVVEVLASNCRKPRSSKSVDNLLQRISKDTPPCGLSFETILLNGLLLKDFRNVITCKFEVLLHHIKDTGICLPTVASALYPFVKELHDIGLLMIIRRNEDQVENHLLLMNTQSLTNDVHQVLFSQAAKKKLSKPVSPQYAKMGIFPERVISSLLPKHITKECLVQLQYCQEFNHAEVGLDCSVIEKVASEDLLLYFPALCNLDSEHSKWTPDPNLDFSIGWFAKCTEKLDFLPPRFSHVLLLRLTFMFALPTATFQTTDFALSLNVLKQNCHCTMWKNGIHWLMSEGIECTVEVVNESRGVVVVVKSRKKHSYQCVHMLAQIVSVITEAKDEFCYSVSLQSHIMNSDDPSSYCNEDKLHKISKVKSALINHDETVLSESGHVSLDLEILNPIRCHTFWGKYD